MSCLTFKNVDSHQLARGKATEGPSSVRWHLLHPVGWHGSGGWHRRLLALLSGSRSGEYVLDDAHGKGRVILMDHVPQVLGNDHETLW